MTSVFHRIKYFAIGVLFASLLITNMTAAQSSGSAVVTVETAGSVVAGAETDIRFYVTSTGTSIYGVSVSVNLSNLTYVSIDMSSSSFNGYAGAPSGNNPGSTAFDIAGSYQAPSTGGSGKLYIGKIRVQAAGTAGTANINLSSAVGVEQNGNSIPTSAQNSTMSITAPPAPTCPSGQVGTPPNCATPTPPAQPANPSNPTTQPNGNSNLIVPSADTPGSEPDIITENEIADIYQSTVAEVDSDQAASAGTENQEKGLINWGITTWAIAAALLITSIAGWVILKRYQRKQAFIRNHIATTAQPNPTTTVTQPVIPPKDSSSHMIEPTIISPEKRDIS